MSIVLGRPGFNSSDPLSSLLVRTIIDLVCLWHYQRTSCHLLHCPVSSRSILHQACEIVFWYASMNPPLIDCWNKVTERTIGHQLCIQANPVRATLAACLARWQLISAGRSETTRTSIRTALIVLSLQKWSSPWEV